METIHTFKEAFDSFDIFNDIYKDIVHEDYKDIYLMEDVYIINKLYKGLQPYISSDTDVFTTCDLLDYDADDNMRTTIKLVTHYHTLILYSINKTLHISFVHDTKKNYSVILSTAFIFYPVEYKIIDKNNINILNIFDNNTIFNNVVKSLKQFI